MSAILEKYGLSVYEKPAPHIPMEDLKLSLGSARFEDFMKRGIKRPNQDGADPEDVKEYLLNS